MAVKVYFKRTLSLIILVCFLTLVVFASLNRPKEVKAAVIPAVVLGVGALAVLVASYFSTAGVQLSQSGSDSTTYFEDFINDSIQQFKEDDAQSQVIFDQYFDSEGRYIGSEEDLQFILSPQARGYWSMGKDLVSGLETYKDWFVNTYNLSSNSSYNFLTESVLIDSITGATYRCFPYNGFTYNATTDDSLFEHIPPQAGDNFLINTENGYFGARCDSTSANGDQLVGTFVLNNNGNVSTWSTNLEYIPNPTNKRMFIIGEYSNHTWNVLSTYYANNLGTYYYSSIMMNIDSVLNDSISDISVDGTLTEGYQDFQDALDQDLANESENDDAVVVTGVGEVGTDLTYDQIKELILQNVITGELNPTYEGTYENQEAAEEEFDQESPIVTPDWRPTPVIVNGLEDFFPFCIPFDFYEVIALLNTEPVAPKFTGHLDFAGIFEAQNIELDFSQFEYLARIVRVIIVIAFLIFIILKTRDMIRG